MKITILGTGTSQGVPVIGCKCHICQSTDKKDKRLRTSVFIETRDKKILIDTSPDFRQQMLNAQINDLDGILYTHEHRDHIAGLDDVRAFNFLHNKSIDIYAEERVIKALKSIFSYSFADKKYPGVPRLNMHSINESPFYIDQIKIIPVRAFHYKLPVLGFRIGDFTYITDANYIDAAEKKKIIGTKHLVINALRKKKHISHYNLSEAIDVVKEISPKRAYLTHISHQMGLHAEVNSSLDKNINLAYDGQVIEL